MNKKKKSKCEYCAASFLQTYDLKQVHKGKKPFRIQRDTSYTKWRCVHSYWEFLVHGEQLQATIPNTVP